MPLTFPLSTATFADQLSAVSFRMWIEEYTQSSGTEGGDVLVAQVAAPKWRAEIGLGPMVKTEAARIQGLMEALGIGGRFYLYDLRKAGPANDRTGAAVGSASVTISAISGRAIRLAGLPANFQMRAGDMLSFDYGSNPVRRALHRLSENALANGAGLSTLADVSPPIKAGTIVGTPVTLYKPAARMMVAAYDHGASEGRFTVGATISAREAR